MKKFSEISFFGQLAIMLLVAGIIVGAGEYVWLNNMRLANQETANKVQVLEADNAKVRPFRNMLVALKADNERLEKQLASLLTIVPEEKEPDVFIRLVQEKALQSGINVRRFTAKAAVQREFYIEAPFDLSLDGNYYTVLQFFDHMARMERIVNVGNLTMRPVTGGGSRYLLTPNETVLATCTATTFFSREGAAKR